jgi:hypothetical protein
MGSAYLLHNLFGAEGFSRDASGWLLPAPMWRQSWSRFCFFITKIIATSLHRSKSAPSRLLRYNWDCALRRISSKRKTSLLRKSCVYSLQSKVKVVFLYSYFFVYLYVIIFVLYRLLSLFTFLISNVFKPSCHLYCNIDYDM